MSVWGGEEGMHNMIPHCAAPSATAAPPPPPSPPSFSATALHSAAPSASAPLLFPACYSPPLCCPLRYCPPLSPCYSPPELRKLPEAWMLPEQARPAQLRLPASPPPELRCGP